MLPSSLVTFSFTKGAQHHSENGIKKTTPTTPSTLNPILKFADSVKSIKIPIKRRRHVLLANSLQMMMIPSILSSKRVMLVPLGKTMQPVPALAAVPSQQCHYHLSELETRTSTSTSSSGSKNNLCNLLSKVHKQLN